MLVGLFKNVSRCMLDPPKVVHFLEDPICVQDTLGECAHRPYPYLLCSDRLLHIDPRLKKNIFQSRFEK